MFVAMNRFRVRKDAIEAFEDRWLKREVHIDTQPGFQSFALLRGAEQEDHVLYASHTIWASRADFEAWTRSENFRMAHRTAGQGEVLTLGHPQFEGFEAVAGSEVAV